MPTAKVKIGVILSNYNGIAALMNTVITGMTANPINFPAPNPSLATLAADFTTLTAAIATWGPVGNRGSHSEYLALLAATLTAYNDLLLEADYVNNLVNPSAPYADQVAFIVSSGFSVKNAPMPQGVLQAPQDVHRFQSLAIDPQNVFLKWKKPLGLTSPNNVKSYIVFRGNSNDFFLSVQIANPTKTKFLDVNTVYGSTYWYWICGVNTDGNGTASGGLEVTV